MAEKIKVRNISPLLQMMRNFLLGRKHIPARSALRYTELVSARTQPPPNLPDGEAHKLSANHYCLRDGRREAMPPVVLADGRPSKKLIEAGGSTTDASLTTKSAPGLKPVTPGKRWDWD